MYRELVRPKLLCAEWCIRQANTAPIPARLERIFSTEVFVHA